VKTVIIDGNSLYCEVYIHCQARTQETHSQEAYACNRRTFIARQRRCKHASLTEDGVFRGVLAEGL
jgi:IS1 family transposase